MGKHPRFNSKGYLPGVNLALWNWNHDLLHVVLFGRLSCLSAINLTRIHHHTPHMSVWVTNESKSRIRYSLFFHSQLSNEDSLSSPLELKGSTPKSNVWITFLFISHMRISQTIRKSPFDIESTLDDHAFFKNCTRFGHGFQQEYDLEDNAAFV